MAIKTFPLYCGQIVNARSFYWATAILVFLTPASILLLKHGSSTPTTILACLGLLSLFIQGTRPLSFDEKMLFKTLLIFFGIVLLSALLGGLNKASMDKLGHYARILLIIPTITLFLRVKLSEKWLWYGMAAGAVSSGLYALYESWQMGAFSGILYRGGGMAGPMEFGHLAMVMGFIPVVGWSFFAKQKRWQMIIPLFSFLFGMTGAFMSGTRGILMTLPVLMLFFWFFSRRSLKKTYQNGQEIFSPGHR